MKKLALLVSISIIGLTAFSQTIKYGEKLKIKAVYTEYISKNNIVFKAGDTLRHGEPKGKKEKFSYIWQETGINSGRLSKSEISETNFIIDRFVSDEGILWAEIKLSPIVYIDIKKALKSGEIIEIPETEKYVKNNEYQYSSINITDTNFIKWDTINARDISFYDNYNRIYKAKVIGLCSGIGAGAFAAGGLLIQSRNALFDTNPSKYNYTVAHIPMYAISGALAITSFVCVIINIVETKKIRDKHEKIRFTGNGVVIKF